MEPLTIAALALSAAGTGASVYSQNQAAKSQEEAALNALRAQQERQDQISRSVEAQTQQLAPESRATREGEAADSITGRINAVIGRARDEGPASITPGVQGRVSSDALTRAAAATEAQALDSATLARLLGQVQAPLRGRQQEAFGAADLSSRIGTLSNFAQGEGALAGREIQQAGQINPYLAGAGQLATGAGNAYIANQGFGGNNTQTQATTTANDPYYPATNSPMFGLPRQR